MATPDHVDPRERALIPYTRHSVTPDDVEAVASVLRSAWLAQGPEVGRFESALASVAGTAHAVAVSSGTAALQVALLALGVGDGDEVIVPPLTFAATANAVLLCGGRPRFVDVEPDTGNLDPASVAAAAARAGPRLRGAIAVHFAGHPADTDAIRAALGPGRFLLEDACHALGASDRGRAAGGLGDAGCFSFHPAKHVTTGEGGAVSTSDAELADRMRVLREHGIERRPERFVGLGLPRALRTEERGDWVYEMQRLSANHRLAEPAAALGRSQLARLGWSLERRRALVELYCKGFADEDLLELPPERPGMRSAWHLFPVRLRIEALRGGRADVFAALRAHGIGVQVHYVPVHLHPHYRSSLGTRWGDLPTAEGLYLRLLSLPLFPTLRETDVESVVDTVRDELRRQRR